MTAKGIELAEKRRFKREVKAQQTPSDWLWQLKTEQIFAY
jgi:hypothetical protein